jgi:AcrR family transcriptional regulator
MERMASRATQGSRHTANAPVHERGSGTDAEIVRVATRLYREQGYHGTSMGDVAAAIGVTSASLYYHFESKQDLLLCVLRSGMESFLESLEAIAAADLPARRKLDRAIANHLLLVLTRRDGVAVFLRERRFLEADRATQHQVRVDRYDELFTDLVTEAATVGELPDVDPAVMGKLLLGTINSVVEWYQPDGPYDQAALTSIVTNLIAGMLGKKA